MKHRQDSELKVQHQEGIFATEAAIFCRALLHKSHTGQPADSHVTYVVAPRNRDQGLALRKSCPGLRLLILGELRFAPEPDTPSLCLLFAFGGLAED